MSFSIDHLHNHLQRRRETATVVEELHHKSLLIYLAKTHLEYRELMRYEIKRGLKIVKMQEHRTIHAMTFSLHQLFTHIYIELRG